LGIVAKERGEADTSTRNGPEAVSSTRIIKETVGPRGYEFSSIFHQAHNRLGPLFKFLAACGLVADFKSIFSFRLSFLDILHVSSHLLLPKRTHPLIKRQSLSTWFKRSKTFSFSVSFFFFEVLQQQTQTQTLFDFLLNYSLPLLLL